MFIFIYEFKVPSGVYVESLLSVDENPEEISYLELIRSQTNSSCFRTIPDMYKYLMNSLKQ